MKPCLTRYALYLAFLCLCSCAKEEEFPLNSPHPILKTISATPDTSGAVVVGEIMSLGTTAITEYGFAYTTTSGTKNIKKQVVGTNAQRGTFKATLTANMVKGVVYDVQAYATTNGITVYGNKLNFSSANSTAPVIQDFSPKEGLDGTLITIVGESFGLSEYNIEVKIGNARAHVVKASIDTIVVRSPEVAYTGSFPITVKVNAEQVVSEEKFTILGPHITHLSVTQGMPGEELTIHGNYFSSAGGWGPYVYFGNIKAKTISVSEREIKVIVPAVTSDLYDRELTVSMSGWEKPVSLPNSFIIESGFATVSVMPSFTGVSPRDTPSFLANGKAYYFSNDRMISYEIASNKWRDEGVFPGHPRTNAIMYLVNGKAYLMGGNYQYYTIFRDIWEYDYHTNNWKKKVSLPFGISDVSSFTLDDKIYFFGGRNTSNTTTLWRYNPETEELVALNPFNNSSNCSGFTSNGMVYMVLGRATWLYNAQQDSWSQVASIPDEGAWNGPHRAFTFNGQGYAIASKNDKGLYRYQVEQNVWEKIAYYPGCVNGDKYTGFAYEDKLYISSFGNCSSTLYSYEQQ